MCLNASKTFNGALLGVSLFTKRSDSSRFLISTIRGFKNMYVVLVLIVQKLGMLADIIVADLLVKTLLDTWLSNLFCRGGSPALGSY